MTPVSLVPVIRNRLYFLPYPPSSSASDVYHYFNTDNIIYYEPFYCDFGPINAGGSYRFCRYLENLLADASLAEKKLVHFSAHDPRKRTNAVTLMCVFQVIVLGRTPQEAFKLFDKDEIKVLPYRDATYGSCSYHLTILDVLEGLAYAKRLGWFDYARFNVDEYEHYEVVKNGDLNWIVPGKFLAFSGPSCTSTDEDGYETFPPEGYITIFRKLGVQLVIRLNKKQYDREIFTRAGIDHLDLYFVDGSCPSPEIVRQFLDVSEKTDGAIAVHCKAGLGRTGTLIGCYAMKQFGFPASYWIGWNRLCRPGSVLGPQQTFLCQMQREMFSQGAVRTSRIKEIRLPQADVVESITKMSIHEKKVAHEGDAGQGDRLCTAKRSPRATAAPAKSIQQFALKALTSAVSTRNSKPKEDKSVNSTPNSTTQKVF